MLNRAYSITWSKIDRNVRASEPAVAIEHVMLVLLVYVNSYFIQQPTRFNAFIIPADTNRSQLYVIRDNVFKSNEQFVGSIC